jgi:hypothetical protein
MHPLLLPGRTPSAMEPAVPQLYIDVQFWRAMPAKIAHQYITVHPDLVYVLIIDEVS